MLAGKVTKKCYSQTNPSPEWRCPESERIQKKSMNFFVKIARQQTFE